MAACSLRPTTDRGKCYRRRRGGSTFIHRRSASAGTSSGVTKGRRLFFCKIAVTRKIGTVSWDWIGLSERPYFALLVTTSLLSGASPACDTVRSITSYLLSRHNSQKNCGL